MDFPIVKVGNFQLTPSGMQVSGSPSYDEWLAFGAKLWLIRRAIQWAIGDWINYGEARYGEKYAQALDVTEVSLSTLQNYAWLSKAFETSRRREVLSWSHHREVKSLKTENEQETMLDRAESEQMGRDELRDAVKEYKAEQKRPEAVEQSDIEAILEGAGIGVSDEPETETSATSSERQPTEQEQIEAPVTIEIVPKPKVRLIVGRSENMQEINDNTVDLIITSPPYNLGDEHWPMGGQGRATREGIGYQDSLPDDTYQRWQLDCLNEMYRVAKDGASLFYNHKPRTKNGRCIHPVQWLAHPSNQWVFRQEIIWNRKATHNHSETLFDPIDERIYWLTKGKPLLGSYGIKMTTIWESFGPIPNTWHPAPFTEELPEMLIKAIGREGKLTVLDPFAGSCTTLRVALRYGYDAIGIDINAEYLKTAAEVNGWQITAQAA